MGGNVWSLVTLALDDLQEKHPESFGDSPSVEKHAFEIRAKLERAEESLDLLARAGARHLVGALVVLGLAAESRDPLVLARRLRDHVRALRRDARTAPASAWSRDRQLFAVT